MWPAYETAVWLYDKANIFLIGALVVGAIATVLVVWMGNVKEEYLKRDIANANERSANAELRAAEANEKAEQERLARVQIEEKIAPRRFSSEQKKSLANKLAVWAKPNAFILQHASVAAFPDTHEANVFAADILSILKAAGWSTYDGMSGMASPKVTVGVVVRTSSNPRSIKVGHAFTDALMGERVLASVLPEKAKGCEEEGRTQEYMDKEPACSMIQILVGDHP